MRLARWALCSTSYLSTLSGMDPRISSPHSLSLLDMVNHHVILLNWDTKKREIDGYLARLWYVGLTRSRGSITIVLPPEGTKFVSAISLSVILSEAKKAGIEVINHVKQA